MTFSTGSDLRFGLTTALAVIPMTVGVLFGTFALMGAVL